MYKFCLIIAAIFLFSCRTTSYYVVRHAEKESTSMSADAPLSEQGRQRADALREALKNKKIGTIYTTNYQRTRNTAQPLASAIGLTLQVYDPRDTTFHYRIVNTEDKDKEGNMLIVGHSNTVDDIVNKLMGQTVVPGDLPDTQYGDLFIIRQRGKKFKFEQKHFGL